MSTVLICWELGGGAGHCVNLRPLAEGLTLAGHAIWFAARDLTTAQAVFADLPVQLLQAPFLTVPPSRAAARTTETFAHVLHNVGFGEGESLSALVAAWHSLIRLVRPQAIICEHAPAALLASRWLDVRRFVLGTGFCSPPDRTPLPNLRPEAPPEVSAAATQCEAAILDRVNRLLKGDDLAPLERVAQLYAETDGNFLLAFPELDHYAHRGPADYYGCCWPPGGLTIDWPPGAPRVFAYLKPPAKNWPLAAALAALRDLDAPTIGYVPSVDRRWLSQFTTPRLRLFSEPIDMDHVASQCAVALTHGNSGTASRLLLVGVPQVLVPLHLEQAAFSRRAFDLGAGLALRSNRLERLATHVRAVAENRAMKTAAAQFAERYAEFDPAAQQQRILRRVVATLE